MSGSAAGSSALGDPAVRESVRIGGEPPATVAARRWRRWRLPVIVAGLLAVSVMFAALIQPDLSSEPLAVDNPGDDGARAVAQVLGRQGVHITATHDLGTAVARATAGTTLAVVTTSALDGAALVELARTEADLVVIDADDDALRALTDHALINTWEQTGASRDAGCQDPDAVAAGTVSGAAYSVLALDERATVCFGASTPKVGAYAVTTQNGRTVRVLADSTILVNSHVAEAGNAALALRALGKHEQLTWFLPRPASYDQVQGAGGENMGAFFPPGAGPVLAWLGLVLVVVAVWRGRALGRVVTEPLPVTVRAAETTVGRARLYRRARSRGHAAASLRAAAARRTAARLGLPRSADAPAIITALAAATGRGTDEVADLLYGPPPTDDVALRALARALDQLESEVHRT